MVFLELFWVFFKQGLLGFGGGYAMLSLMQHDVVESHAWIDHQQFADIVALSQMTPGPICINAATYVGYNAAFDAYGSVGMGIAGSLLASIAVCLPSLFVIWVVMAFLLKHRNNPVVGGVVDSFKLISVALIASVAVMMMNHYNFIDHVSILIFLGVFALSFWKRFSPILCILLCSLVGFLVYY